MQSEISLPREILSSVEQALAEDIGSGDVTTNSIVPAEATLEGTMVAKQFGVAAGLAIAQLVFQVLDKRVNFSPRTSDSESVKAGQILAAIRGPARAILSGERKHHKGLEIEMEARRLMDVEECLELGVTWIMLDNMSHEEIRQAVLLSNGRAKLEASGNVTLANVRHIANTGVDYISVGALTHSFRNFDVSLTVSKVSV